MKHIEPTKENITGVYKVIPLRKMHPGNIAILSKKPYDMAFERYCMDLEIRKGQLQTPEDRRQKNHITIAFRHKEHNGTKRSPKILSGLSFPDKFP